MARKKRDKYVMVYLTDDEKTALETWATGEPLGRVAREIICARLMATGTLDKPKR